MISLEQLTQLRLNFALLIKDNFDSSIVGKIFQSDGSIMPVSTEDLNHVKVIKALLAIIDRLIAQKKGLSSAHAIMNYAKMSASIAYLFSAKEEVMHVFELMMDTKAYPLFQEISYVLQESAIQAASDKAGLKREELKNIAEVFTRSNNEMAIASDEKKRFIQFKEHLLNAKQAIDDFSKTEETTLDKAKFKLALVPNLIWIIHYLVDLHLEEDAIKFIKENIDLIKTVLMNAAIKFDQLEDYYGLKKEDKSAEKQIEKDYLKSKFYQAVSAIGKKLGDHTLYKDVTNGVLADRSIRHAKDNEELKALERLNFCLNNSTSFGSLMFIREHIYLLHKELSEEEIKEILEVVQTALNSPPGLVGKLLSQASDFLGISSLSYASDAAQKLLEQKKQLIEIQSKKITKPVQLERSIAKEKRAEYEEKISKGRAEKRMLLDKVKDFEKSILTYLEDYLQADIFAGINLGKNGYYAIHPEDNDLVKNAKNLLNLLQVIKKADFSSGQIFSSIYQMITGSYQNINFQAAKKAFILISSCTRSVSDKSMQIDQYFSNIFGLEDKSLLEENALSDLAIKADIYDDKKQIKPITDKDSVEVRRAKLLFQLFGWVDKFQKSVGDLLVNAGSALEKYCGATQEIATDSRVLKLLSAGIKVVLRGENSVMQFGNLVKAGINFEQVIEEIKAIMKLVSQDNKHLLVEAFPIFEALIKDMLFTAEKAEYEFQLKPEKLTQWLDPAIDVFMLMAQQLGIPVSEEFKSHFYQERTENLKKLMDNISAQIKEIQTNEAKLAQVRKSLRNEIAAVKNHDGKIDEQLASLHSIDHLTSQKNQLKTHNANLPTLTVLKEKQANFRKKQQKLDALKPKSVDEIVSEFNEMEVATEVKKSSISISIAESFLGALKKFVALLTMMVDFPDLLEISETYENSMNKKTAGEKNEFSAGSKQQIGSKF